VNDQRSEEDRRLAEIGIEVITDDDGPLVRAECIRIARRLHATGEKIIGLIPAADDVAIPPLGIQLGVALTELTGATIAFVDANARYPGLSALATDHRREDSSFFSTRWLRGSLALLTPPRDQRSGEAVPQLARLLLDGVDLFEHVLVDLTGFELLGEHGSAAACMDAVMLVGRAHRTREKELLRFRAEMPQKRFLGVLLVG
jgi:hypothetical protein